MNAAETDPPMEDGERVIDLGLYFGLLKAGWRSVILGAVIGLAVGLLLIRLTTPEYTISMLVRPPPENASSQAGRGLSSLVPGLATILQSGGRTDFDAFKALLTSNELSGRVAARHRDDVMVPIFQNWDPQAQTWTHFGMIADIKDGIKSILGMPAWYAPSGEDLQRYLVSHISQSTDIKTGMATITAKGTDPAFVTHLLKVVATEADGLARDQAKQRSAARLAYLQKALQTVVQADQHQVLIELFSQEEQQMMMVQADASYAALPVDVPSVPHRPSWPPVMPFLMLFTVLGAGVSGFRIINKRARWISF